MTPASAAIVRTETLVYPCAANSRSAAAISFSFVSAGTDLTAAARLALALFTCLSIQNAAFDPQRPQYTLMT